MKFAVTYADSGWIVSAVDGKFAGQVVAVVEGLDMMRVQFFDQQIVGEIRAIWGAVLNDEITTHPATLRALGVGSRMSLLMPSSFNMKETTLKVVAERLPKGAFKVVLMNNTLSYKVDHG